MFVPNSEWSANAAGLMHRYRIKGAELAERCGYTAAYVSTVLNGNKTFESEQAADRTRDKILAVLDEIVAERKLQMDADADDDGASQD